MSDGKEVAEDCMEALDARSCDPMMVFWLRHPALLQQTGFGKVLLELARQNGWSSKLMANADTRRDFFQAVRDRFNTHKIRPISPGNSIAEYGNGGKERAMAALAKAKWIQPYQPFCIQTRNPTHFFVLKTFQDGLVFLCNMFKDGYMGSSITLAYEHCWGDDRLSCLLIDWELEEDKVKGRFDAAHAQKLAWDFPKFFVDRLRQVGAIDKNVSIRVTVKDKTRPVASGFKISYHFVFNVVSTPRGGHSHVCKLVIHPWIEQLKKIRSSKNFDSVADSDLATPIWGLDFGTLHGGQGFSTLFSKKKASDPPPRLEYFLRVTESAVHQEDFPWGAECALDKLSRDTALFALYYASFTPPFADTVAYSPAILREKVVPPPSARRIGSAGDPLGGGGRSGGGSGMLPTFLDRWLRQSGGYTANTTMPCLDGVRSSLRHVLMVAEQASAERVMVCRVSHCPCPVLLAQTPVDIHVHKSNGVFVGVVPSGDTVYLACSNCQMSDSDELPGFVHKCSLGGRYHWTSFNEDTWRDIVAAGSTKRTKG